MWYTLLSRLRGTQMPYKDPEVAKRKNHERYLANREQTLARTKKYNAEHKEQHAVSQKKWNEKNKEKMDAYYTQWRSENREKCVEKSRKYRAKLRDECFAAYGNKCFCCGQTVKEFLAMDHVFGGGNRHRQDEKALRGGGGIHLYLKKRGYPATFRLSCHNCNLSRGFYGYCPHEKERAAGFEQPDSCAS